MAEPVEVPVTALPSAALEDAGELVAAITTFFDRWQEQGAEALGVALRSNADLWDSLPPFVQMLLKMAETLLVGYVKGGSTTEEIRRVTAGAVHPIRPCISCGRVVYVNHSGLACCRDRDCDVVCELCEARYDAELMRNL